MEPVVRPFREEDIPHLVEVLKLNGQYDYPEVDGPEAMRRVAACEAAIFLVAEADGRPCGLLRAVDDGSRALIHLLSIHPEDQGKGIGSALVDAAVAGLREGGTPTVSVTVSEKSAGFWEKQDFMLLPVSLMLRELKG